jgi:hypothetical protein
MSNIEIDGFGYIYILSNPSILGLKVGYTNNSVIQRISELSSATGVPTKFSAEATYMMHSRYLVQVETLSHQKLKKDNHHLGKEFFDVDILKCILIVEGAIRDITCTKATNLITKYNSEIEKLNQIQRTEKAKIELEEYIKISDQQARQKKLDWINLNLKIMRENYIREQLHLRGSTTRKILSNFIIPGMKTHNDLCAEIIKEANSLYQSRDLWNLDSFKMDFPTLVKEKYYK